LEQTWHDIAEDEVRKADPEATPPAGDEAGTRSDAGAGQTDEDLDDHVVREGADEVSSSAAAWTTKHRMSTMTACSIHGITTL
jgi:hypothetical protein